MRYTPRFIVKTSLVAIVSGFIVGYALFQSQNLMTGPVVTVHAPESGLSSRSEVAEIRGVAKNVAFLTFNDRQIYTDLSGTWSEKVLLSEGYNIVKLSAKDKFGRVTEQTIELVYEAPETTASLSAITNSDNGKAN